jgi:hypothetical protein
MNFSTDRDLLIYEPTLFQDVPWASQERAHVTDAVTSGTTLTSVNGDFASAAVGVGHVVMIDQTPYEVISRLSSTELKISRLRARLTDEALPVPPGSEQVAIVRTFEPQAAMLHEQLLHLLGLESERGSARVTEQAIISVSVMARLEALGTLERVFSGAAAMTGDNEALHRKATEYREQFAHALRRATILLDVDGDGRVDQRRSFSDPRLTRV